MNEHGRFAFRCSATPLAALLCVDRSAKLASSRLPVCVKTLSEPSDATQGERRGAYYRKK